MHQRSQTASWLALLLLVLCLAPTAISEDFSFIRTDYFKNGSYCAGNVTVADFSRDGKPDLAFACGNLVGVLLNKGQGAFADVVYYPTPPNVGVTSLAAADFNGDGFLDLAMHGRDPYPGALLLMLGNGDGTFQLPTQIATIFGAFVAAGDLNNDGHPDLTVVKWQDGFEPGGVSVLLNNGTGTFTVSPLISTGGSPQALSIADLNGDGLLDIVALNYAWYTPPASVAVLINDGGGTFAPAVSYPAGTSPVALVAADFNGDGRPDIAVANNDKTVLLLIGQGNGSFTPGAILSVPYAPVSITAADFNHDGAMDLATVANTLEPIPAVSILPGKGDGTFAEPVGVATDYWAFFIASADLNADGYPDLVTANSLLGSVTVLLYGATPLPPSPYEWVQVSASGAPRVLASAASYDPATNQLIQFGGSFDTSLPGGGSNSIWRLSHANGLGGAAQWENHWGGYIDQRSEHTFAYDAAHSRFMIHGGSFGYTLWSDSWVLANANGVDGDEQWQLLPGGGPPPRLASAAYDPVTNRLMVFGGLSALCWGYCDASNELWILSEANGLGSNSYWSSLPTAGEPPSPRFGAAVAYDTASNRLIVAGGVGPTGVLADTWVLANANGAGPEMAQWIQVLASGAPTRYAPLFAHDPANNRLFLVGGEKRMCFGHCPGENDVWVLRHANGLGGTPQWRPLRTSRGVPAGRYDAVGGYDPIESRLIVSGGLNTYGFLEDTWVLTNLNIPENQPPVAEAGQNQTLIVRESAAFNSEGSTDPDGTITAYHWAFGDNNAADGAVVNHAYASAGQFTVTLTVTDDFGATASDSATVIVLTTSQAIDSLTGLVASYNLRQGIANSLDTKLQNALAALQAANAGQRQDAANKLMAFINAAEAQRGKELTSLQVDELISMARRVLNVI